MFTLFRPQVSHLCHHCRGIGLVAALALVPCNCHRPLEGLQSVPCTHCTGSGMVEIDIEETCPTCRGTALNKRPAA